MLTQSSKERGFYEDDILSIEGKRRAYGAYANVAGGNAPAGSSLSTTAPPPDGRDGRRFTDLCCVLFAALALLATFPSQAVAQTTVLDQYIQEGLEQNLTVQQSRYATQASEAAVTEARGGYLPSLDLQGRYTWAGGGRTIDFPVGDLLNPAYGALNQLLPGGGSFPTVSNEQISFLRTREQETKFRLLQPIFQPAVAQNIKIRSALSDAASEQLGATKRDVVAQIKTAYYQYLAAEKAVLILKDAKTLVDENLRVSKSLFDNGKATADAVYRAEAEASTVEQDLAKAQTDRDLAASAFNLKLNRPLDTPIVDESVDDLLAAAAHLAPAAEDKPSLVRHALASREELRQLDFTADAARANLNLARSSYLPNLSFALDYGIQGTGYSFSSDSDFRSASLVLSWNIFNGFQTQARTQQAQLTRRQIEAQRDLASQQIALQVQDSRQRLDVADHSIVTAESRLRSARQSYKLVSRRYEEGMATQIELLDARTSLTRAELNLAVTQYDLLIRYAELERSAALYPL